MTAISAWAHRDTQHHSVEHGDDKLMLHLAVTEIAVEVRVAHVQGDSGP